MKKRKSTRIKIIIVGLFLLGFSTFLIGFGLRETIQFFYTPSQLVKMNYNVNNNFRVGGLVKVGSIKKGKGKKIEFILEDQNNQIKIFYEGILPDLFKERMGIIASGFLNSEKNFIAKEILAKHDENYLPAEIVDSLKKQGIFVQTK